MGRFDDRTTRLARRQESDAFRNYVMPVSWLFGFSGLLGLGALWMADGWAKMPASPVFPVLCGLFGAPAATFVLRLVRGHFHPAVRES
jgi:hypothetical protein